MLPGLPIILSKDGFTGAGGIVGGGSDFFPFSLYLSKSIRCARRHTILCFASTVPVFLWRLAGIEFIREPK